MHEYCDWEEDDEGVWFTSCGEAFQAEDGGAPAEHHYSWCPFCGNEINEIRYVWEDTEE